MTDPANNRLRELEQRLEAAGIAPRAEVNVAEDGSFWIWSNGSLAENIQDKDAAEFLANADRDVRWLVDRVKHLTAENTHWRSEAEQLDASVEKLEGQVKHLTEELANAIDNWRELEWRYQDLQAELDHAQPVIRAARELYDAWDFVAFYPEGPVGIDDMTQAANTLQDALAALDKQPARDVQ